MAKRKKKLTGGLFDRLVQVAGSDPEESLQVSRIYGIPMPGLTWPWMLGVSMFPLGRIVHLAGPESSYKTSMAYEIARWHLEYGGYAIYIETESKDNPYQREAFLGDCMERLVVHAAASMEDWQQTVTGILKAMSGYMEESGVCAPVCVIIDSLRGKPSRSVIEGVLDSGYAGLNFPRDPALINTFLQSISPMLVHLPVTIVFTNHLKEDISSMVPGQFRTPGGRSVKYYESFEIWQTASMPDQSGKVRVDFTSKKVQFGVPGKQPYGLVRWDGDRAVWDWYSPAVRFLCEPTIWKVKTSQGTTAKIMAPVAEKLSELLGSITYSPAHQTVTCEAIGVRRVSPEEFWEALSSHPVFPRVLEALEINTRIEPWPFLPKEQGDGPDGENSLQQT